MALTATHVASELPIASLHLVSGDDDADWVAFDCMFNGAIGLPLAKRDSEFNTTALDALCNVQEFRPNSLLEWSVGTDCHGYAEGLQHDHKKLCWPLCGVPRPLLGTL